MGPGGKRAQESGLKRTTDSIRSISELHRAFFYLAGTCSQDLLLHAVALLLWRVHTKGLGLPSRVPSTLPKFQAVHI